jgi:chemotaxis protein histidine kinase CheA
MNNFCDESIKLIRELEAVLKDLEENPQQKDKFNQFAQMIDRMRRTARTFSAEEICSLCELGKMIGIRAAMASDVQLLNVVVGVLFDGVYILEKMIVLLRTGDRNVLQGMNTKVFATRLKWLSEKFKDVDTSENLCASRKEKELSQNAIDDLLKSLGL